MILYYLIHFNKHEFRYTTHRECDDHFNVYSDTIANYSDSTLAILQSIKDLHMDVLFPAGFIVALIFAYISITKVSNLKRESEHLSQMLVSSIKDFERELEDHKESVQELALLRAKMEGLKQSTLTPDNSVPKSMHVEKVLELCGELSSVKSELVDITKKFEESRGKQISERVRLGAVSENLAAFTDEFPYDRSKVKALFQPVDLIYFGEDEVVFIDVKSGASSLSTKQRRIRDNVNNGKVKFRVMRINDDGISWED